MTKHNVDQNLSEVSILQDFILATIMIIFLGIGKGQLISEWHFGVFKSPKKPTKF